MRDIGMVPSRTNSLKGRTKLSGVRKVQRTLSPASTLCLTDSFISLATWCLLCRYSTASLSLTT